MTKLARSLLAAATFVTAPAIAETPLDFTYEGHHIVGTVSDIGAIRLIKGEDLTSHQAFDLKVKKGYVTGTVDRQEVSYWAPKAKTVQLASR